MCYATKRKIADCVKTLMRHKDITKITILDIMDETHMSRQSFYYHFKDIYDVLEWIGVNDFEKQLSSNTYDNLEDFICDLLKVLRKEHFFYEKMVNEIAWPRIIKCVRKPVTEQVENIFSKGNERIRLNHPEELKECVEFFSTSFCYYILDYIYQRKDVPDKAVIKDIRFMAMMLKGSQILPEDSLLAVFPKVMAM